MPTCNFLSMAWARHESIQTCLTDEADADISPVSSSIVICTLSKPEQGAFAELTLLGLLQSAAPADCTWLPIS